MNDDRARRHAERFSAAGLVVRALAVDPDGRMGGGGLHDGADECGADAGDAIGGGRPRVRERNGGEFAFEVVGGGEIREVDDGGVALLAVHEGGDLFRRTAEADDKDARGEGVERSGMADLGAPDAAADESADIRGGPAERFVDDEDAVEIRAKVLHSVPG